MEVQRLSFLQDRCQGGREGKNKRLKRKRKERQQGRSVCESVSSTTKTAVCEIEEDGELCSLESQQENCTQDQSHGISLPKVKGVSVQADETIDANFVPRSSSEQVRNCTLVDRSLQRYVVSTLTRELLQSENWIRIAVEKAVPNNEGLQERGDPIISQPSSADSHSVRMSLGHTEVFTHRVGNENAVGMCEVGEPGKREVMMKDREIGCNLRAPAQWNLGGECMDSHVYVVN